MHYQFFTARSRTKSQGSIKPPSAKSKKSKTESVKLETNTGITDLSGSGVPQPFADDTYGIPLLEISSSSDSDVSVTMIL